VHILHRAYVNKQNYMVTVLSSIPMCEMEMEREKLLKLVDYTELDAARYVYILNSRANCNYV
jgi:hypothetical protein